MKVLDIHEIAMVAGGEGQSGGSDGDQDGNDPDTSVEDALRYIHELLRAAGAGVGGYAGAVAGGGVGAGVGAAVGYAGTDAVVSGLVALNEANSEIRGDLMDRGEYIGHLQPAGM